MKILCLYNNECAIELFDWLKEQGHETVLQSKQLEPEWCINQKFELTVSYTYRYILSREILEALGDNAVNIHNSFLPWNRGADPNIWSLIDKTPRGVTLHYISEDLDKGDIIAQQLVADLNCGETLASTYEYLDKKAKKLFKDAFTYYDSWNDMRKKALGTGSYHKSSDADIIKSSISSYDMNVSAFCKIVYSLLKRQ